MEGDKLFSDLFWHTRSPVYGLKGVVASSQVNNLFIIIILHYNIEK